MFIILSPSLRAQSTAEIRTQTDPMRYQILRTDKGFKIDGSLDEPAWKNALAMPVDYERYPEANANPPVNTTVLLAYDRKNLYIAFKAHDPSPAQIRAHLMDRDQQEQISRDDHVGFIIDPFNNGEWGFQFQVNPLGVQADAIYSDQAGSTDYSWDAIWKSAGMKTAHGYNVEMRIPFTSLNTPSASQQTWRFSAFRVYPRNVQYRILSHPIDLNNQSFMDQFERISGLENLSSGLNIELNPVLTTKRTDEVPPGTASSELENGSVSLNPGGNFRWGIQPNINFSATVNPDFSQIEADALQLRENARFVLSFPEKRPFFLESAEIFETPLNAVFTRSIIQPEAGIKLTGKSGDHSFGTFITRNQHNRLIFPSNQQSTQVIRDTPSYSEIIRYRNQITPNGAVGILFEGRQGANSGYQNYVGGVDGYFRVSDSNTLRFQYLHATTDYSRYTAESFKQPFNNFVGNALDLTFSHSSKNWQANAGFTSISPGFRNDNGFFARADFRTYKAGIKRKFRGTSSGWFSSLQFGPAFEYTTDQQGNLTDRSYSFSATYRGPYQSEFFTAYSRRKQRFSDQLFDQLDSWQFFTRLQPSDFLSKIRLYIATGDEIDFTNVRRANQLIIHPGITFNLTQSLHFELDPNFQRLQYNGVTTFSSYLLGSRLVYHFNKKTFLRSVFQYRFIDRNLDQFTNPDLFDSTTETFFYQLLFSYKVNPQSKLFLGYSSGYNGINNKALDLQNRTGFLKIGYAWVF